MSVAAGLLLWAPVVVLVAVLFAWAICRDRGAPVAGRRKAVLLSFAVVATVVLTGTTAVVGWAVHQQQQAEADARVPGQD